MEAIIDKFLLTTIDYFNRLTHAKMAMIKLKELR